MMNVDLKQQNVGKTTYLMWNIDDERLKVDMFAMNMMSYNRMTHVIPTQVVQNDDRRQAQFDITGLTKMSSVLAEIRPKQEVLLFFNSILNAFEEVEAYMLDPDHLLLDWEYVYLDGQKNCRLLYFPFVQSVSTRDRVDFLREAVSRIKPDYQGEDTYLYDLLNAFSRGAVRTDSDFRELLKKSAGASAQRHVEETGAEKAGAEMSHAPYTSVPPAAEGALHRADKGVPGRKPATNSGIPVINIPGREPGTKAAPQKPPKENKPPKEKKNHFSFVTSKKPKEKSARTPATGGAGTDIPEGIKDTAGFGRPVQDTADSQNEMYERDEGTVIMQAPPAEQRRMESTEFVMITSARLIRKRSGASYPVKGDRVTVGSGVAADICIDHNNTISREHAYIVCMDGKYYVEDHQSRNGTFINGTRLQAGRREPLYSGMTIKLSNEEFEFVMS